MTLNNYLPTVIFNTLQLPINTYKLYTPNARFNLYNDELRYLITAGKMIHFIGLSSTFQDYLLRSASEPTPAKQKSLD